MNQLSYIPIILLFLLAVGTGIKMLFFSNEKYRRESIKWRDWRYDRRHVRRAINSYDN
jgi:hypothetical protein